jgi:hypothetical protein
MKTKGIVISLCDYTGIFVQPWLDAGHHCILVDPQHSKTGKVKENLYTINKTVEEALPALGEIIRENKIAFVAGFPVCTAVAVSGARWWEEKRKKDPYFQAKAAILAEQCRTIGEISGGPYFFENPVSAFSNIFGKPDYTFHPCDYTGYYPGDNYTKRTCLWVGNGFVMPKPKKDLTLGIADSRIHKMPPGPERQNKRSATPRGFSEAVYQSNNGDRRI